MIGAIYQTIIFFHCGIPIVVTTYCESTIIFKWILIKFALFSIYIIGKSSYFISKDALPLVRLGETFPRSDVI